MHKARSLKEVYTLVALGAGNRLAFQQGEVHEARALKEVCASVVPGARKRLASQQAACAGPRCAFSPRRAFDYYG